jgi:hypothetical protein
MPPMPLLDDATIGEVERLLDLFPVANLRETWHDVEALTKTPLCTAVANSQPRGEIASFLETAFGCCKQHVHLFEREGKQLELPDAIEGGEKIRNLTARSALYLAKSRTTVVLTEPHQDGAIDFLWPVKILATGKHVIVSLVILEKDIASYFPRRALVNTTGLSEDAIVDGVMRDMGLTALDVHKGVKALWDAKYMDCHYTKYRKAKSAANEIVDKTETKGIRENDAPLYAVLRTAKMRQSVFHIDPSQKTSVDHFGVDLTMGTLAFTTYTANAQDTANVVRKILQNN